MSRKLTKTQTGLIKLISMLETKMPEEQQQEPPKTQPSTPTESSPSLPASKALEELTFNKYRKFIKRLDRVDIEDSVFVHSSLLFKKVMSRRKRSLKKKDIIRIFGVCLFISFKYVVDDLLFYVQDYCTLTRMNQEMVEMLEVAILANIVGFNLSFGREEYLQEKRNLELIGCGVE